MLAHAGSPDESLAMLLLAAGVWTGWAGLSRIRGKGFARVPVIGAWALGVAGVGLIVGAGLVPHRLFPRTATGPRIASTAEISIAQPTPAEDVAGSGLKVVMNLDGGTIVDTSSTRLAPDTGHVHLSLDGTLVSMTYGLGQVVDLHGVPPGEHTLRAEFVAANHQPFDPRVVATVRFRMDEP